METINSMATAAAKAVWGEGTTNDQNTTASTTATMNNETQGREPISGTQGDTSKGEPFDAGNMDTGKVTPSTTTAPTTAGDSTTSAPATAGDSTTAAPAASASTPAVGSKGPTADQPSTTSDTGFKAAQADIRDPETSETADPKKEAERKNVDATGEGIDASENPSKVDGPGPRPVAEVAKEAGGDAGSAGKKSAGGSESALPDDKAAEGEDDGKEKGTGEKYVKSSGLAADGGDFDVTKPGAGREADRLLEEKGILNPAAAAEAAKKKKSEGEEQEGDKAAPESPDTKEKKSLKDKIKSKLHKN